MSDHLTKTLTVNETNAHRLWWGGAPSIDVGRKEEGLALSGPMICLGRWALQQSLYQPDEMHARLYILEEAETLRSFARPHDSPTYVPKQALGMKQG